MKKIVIIISIIMLLYLNQNSTEEIIIPNESIRIRVIANSNNSDDQNTKRKVRSYLEEDIAPLLKNVTTKEEVSNILKENIDNFSITIEKALTNTNYSDQYEIKYGMNYFPEKKFKGITYQEGVYESLVVTLGEGIGDNWWCVLFPPLCLMEEDEENMEEVEYKSFIKEIIDKYF